MVRISKIARLLRSSMLLLFFAVVFVIPMYALSQAANPNLKEPAPKPAPVKQELNQPTTPDSRPQASTPVTLEEIRQAKIEADTKKLFELSAELRAEVAKTYKESLSLSVLKKAEEIEKLARGLKTLMSQEAATGR